MGKMRKIVTGAGTEQHIQSVIRNYQGKIILISTHPDKQKGFKKVDIDQLDQAKNFERIAIEAVWHDKGISCPYEVRENLEAFIMTYEIREDVILIFDDIDHSMPWYVPYILDNSELITADMLITVQDMDTLEGCFETNYIPTCPEKQKFVDLVSKWNFGISGFLPIKNIDVLKECFKSKSESEYLERQRLADLTSKWDFGINEFIPLENKAIQYEIWLDACSKHPIVFLSGARRCFDEYAAEMK